MKLPTWTPSVEQGWATCHVAIAMALVFGLALFGCPAQLLTLVLWATVKEFVFDILIERDSWTSSWTDWSWYMVGGIVAKALVLLT